MPLGPVFNDVGTGFGKKIGDLGEKENRSRIRFTNRDRQPSLSESPGGSFPFQLVDSDSGEENPRPLVRYYADNALAEILGSSSPLNLHQDEEAIRKEAAEWMKVIISKP